MWKWTRKNELIPLEKSRRVIYLDRRGPEGRRLPVLTATLIILGVLCLLYCLGIGLFMGYGTNFFLMWGALGLGLLGLGWILGYTPFFELLPRWGKLLAAGIVALGILLCVLIQGMIFSCFHEQPPEGIDYCIVLGALVRENGPSDVLKRRLDVAIDYLEQNPETRIIVSGAQGVNEPMTEAQGMYQYLTAAGIEPERILLEEEAVNTYTNLAYSSQLLDKETDSVVVVTNNFHVFRATGIARKQGYNEVYGLAASSYPGMLPNNLLRETMGVIKDFIVGNL